MLKPCQSSKIILLVSWIIQKYKYLDNSIISKLKAIICIHSNKTISYTFNLLKLSSFCHNFYTFQNTKTPLPCANQHSPRPLQHLRTNKATSTIIRVLRTRGSLPLGSKRQN